MKTVGAGITADQDAQRQAQGNSVIYLAEIDLPVSGTQYYSTRAVTVQSQAYKTLLRDPGDATKLLHTDVVTPGNFAGDDNTIYLTNIPEDTSNQPELLMDTDRFENAVVRLYMIFDTGDFVGTPAITADKIAIHTYVVDDVQIDGRFMVLRLADFTVGKCDKRVGLAVTIQDFPRADPAWREKLIPHVIGDCPDCPLIPVDVGGWSRCKGTVDADPDVQGDVINVWDLSDDPLSPHYFGGVTSGGDTFLSPVTIQIGAEKITVRRRDLTNKRFYDITRGASSTTPAHHSDGDEVRTVLPLYSFAVAAHQCKSVTNIRAGGRVITGTAFGHTLPGPDRDLATAEDNQIIQMLGLTSIPTWNTVAPTVQTSEFDEQVNALTTLGTGSTCQTPHNVTNPNVRAPALIDSDNPTLKLKGNLTLDADVEGEGVKVLLNIEYEANARRAPGAITDPIWQAGEFGVTIQPAAGIKHEDMNAPLWLSCIAPFNIKPSGSANVGIGSPNNPSMRGAFERKDVGGQEPRYEEVLTAEALSTYPGQAWSQAGDGGLQITGKWALQATVPRSPGDAYYHDWLPRYGITPSDGVLRVIDQSVLFNGDVHSGLYNLAITRTSGANFTLAVDTLWKATIWKDKDPAEVRMGNRKIDKLGIWSWFWYPPWNDPAGLSNPQTNIGTINVGFYKGGTWQWAPLQVVPSASGVIPHALTLFEPALQAFGILTVSDLVGADIAIWIPGVTVAWSNGFTVSTDGVNQHCRNQFLVTSLEVKISGPDSLKGYDENLVTDLDMNTLANGTQLAPRAVQRINCTDLFDDNQWDLFESGTTVEIDGTNAQSSQLHVYRVWWTVEHRPYRQNSGFGQVVADVQGYATTGGALVQNPADVVSMLLTNKTAGGTAITDADFADGIDHTTYIDSTSFSAAYGSLQPIGNTFPGFRLARRIDSDESIRGLIASVLGESRLRLFFESGKFNLKYLENDIGGPLSGAPDIDESMQLREIRRTLTTTSEIVNRAILTYRENYTNGGESQSAVQRDFATSQSEPWGVRSKTYSLKWHQNSPNAIVESLADLILSRKADKRLIARIETPLILSHLERGDNVLISSTRGRLDNAVAEVIGVRFRGLSKMGFSLSMPVATSSVFWSSGLCRIITEPFETGVGFWHDNVLLGRIDSGGNLQIKRALVEGDEDVTPSEHDTITVCDAGGLRLNTDGFNPSKFAGALYFKQASGDLEFDGIWTMQPNWVGMFTSPQAAVLVAGTTGSIKWTAVTLRGVVVAEILQESGGPRAFKLLGGIETNAF